MFTAWTSRASTGIASPAPTSTNTPTADGWRRIPCRPSTPVGAGSASSKSGTARSCARFWSGRRKIGWRPRARTSRRSVTSTRAAWTRRRSRPRDSSRSTRSLAASSTSRASPSSKSFGSTQDAKNSTQVIGGAEQGGLGLPDRDYYTKTDDKSKQLREQYVQHVAKMFELMGDNPAQARAEAKAVVGIETALADASMTRVERRDPDKTYHKMELSQLAALTPSFAWPAYFRDLGYADIREVDVAQPKFFEAATRMLTSASLADWKTYLRWHLIDATAPSLSAKFVEEDFSFNGRTL
ncbi:MAG: hypothetical protein DMG26_20690, partial [Acidobacteria bacterium]